MEKIYALIDTVLPFAWLEPVFMKNAFLAILAACPLFGLLGTTVVTNRMSFFSDAIGHSALTGIALGVVLGFRDVTVSMVIFSLVLGFFIITVKRKGNSSTDTIIGIFSSASVALGIVLLSSGGNFAKYQKYLVGDILSIEPREIMLLVVALALTLLTWLLFYNKILLVSLHGTFAKSRGIRTFAIEQVSALLIAVIVTISIRWTGLLVINSILVLPAATSRLISRSTGRFILSAVVISLVSGIAGLCISYYIDSASGATIVLANALLFVACLVWKTATRSR